MMALVHLWIGRPAATHELPNSSTRHASRYSAKAIPHFGASADSSIDRPGHLPRRVRALPCQPWNYLALSDGTRIVPCRGGRDLACESWHLRAGVPVPRTTDEERLNSR